LPTTILALRRGTICWVIGAKFAVDEITFDLFVRLSRKREIPLTFVGDVVGVTDQIYSVAAPPVDVANSAPVAHKEGMKQRSDV